MISMSIDICWKVILNTTELSWQELQTKLKEITAKETLHCLSTGELEIVAEDVLVKDVLLDVYCRLQNNAIEFAVIGKRGETNE